MDNIWNFDKKGFIIGFARTIKRIITRLALETSRVIKARQDSARDFISCLVYINALGRKIAPCLIYPSILEDL